MGAATGGRAERSMTMPSSGSHKSALTDSSPVDTAPIVLTGRPGAPQTPACRRPCARPTSWTRGRRWPGDEMDAIARAWRAVLREHLPGDERPIAVALPSTPEGVALLVALTSLPPPVILLERSQHEPPPAASMPTAG